MRYSTDLEFLCYVTPDVDENRTDELALHAHGFDGNGFPLASASEFRRFVAAWSANDHNGTWNTDGILETESGTLFYIDGDGIDSLFFYAGETDRGVRLYAMRGAHTVGSRVIGSMWTWFE